MEGLKLVFSESELEKFLRGGCGKNLRRKKPLKICSTTCPLQGVISEHASRKSLRINSELYDAMSEHATNCDFRGDEYVLRISGGRLARHAKRVCKTNLVNRKEKANICRDCPVREPVFELLLEEYPEERDRIQSRKLEYLGKIS